MQAARVLFAAILVSCQWSCALSASVTPVQKVIQLLQDMQAKAKEEMQAEQVRYADFGTFCKNELASKKKEIEEENEQIEQLGAAIEKAEADAAQLGKEIAQLNADLDKFAADKKAQEDQRAADHAEYMTSLQDYEESLDALDRAILVLQRRAGDVKQADDAEALIQLTTNAMVPERAKRLISVFLEMGMGEKKGPWDDKKAQDAADAETAAQDAKEDSFRNYEAPEANAYEFQSGGIVDMLKNLKDKFRDEKAALEKAEMNSKHAADMMIQDLSNSIDSANRQVGEKTAQKSEREESAANDKKELGATIADRDEDVKYLNDLTVECDQKGKSFDEKQALRAEEIEAIGKAIEILSGDAVSGAADKHLPGLVQQAVSLVQLRSGKRSQASGVHARLTEFLNHEARRLHSRSLSMLAEKVAADAADTPLRVSGPAGPFAKVKKMIRDMITRLLEEANADAEQKGFCDKELGQNKITRDKLSTDIASLQAAIEEGTATSQKLGEEIAELTAAVAELQNAMATATEQREDEKAKNEQTIEDAKAAQAAVEQATAVLKDFYEKAAGATAFVQTRTATKRVDPMSGRDHPIVKMGSDEWNSLANPNYEEGAGKDGETDFHRGTNRGHKEGMQTFGDKYTGQQDEAGGVLAMLEIIMSDFANLEADTTAAEAEAAKAHLDFMRESEKDKAVKFKSIEMKTADKLATDAKVQSDTKDLKATQDELLAADRYYEKLKPQCVDEGVSYEERVKARESEIASLREALQILSGDDIAF